MKIKLVCCLMLFSVIQLLCYNVQFDQNNFEICINSNNYNVIENSDLEHNHVIGSPQLPIKFLSYIIPKEKNVSNIVLTTTTTELSGTYNICPVQYQVFLMDGYEPKSFVHPDSFYYSENKLFPEKPIEIEGHGYIDGANRIVTIAVYPYQYNPVTQKLTFNTNISFTFEFENSSDKIVYPGIRTLQYLTEIDNQLSSFVENPEDITQFHHVPQYVGDYYEEDQNECVVIASNEQIPYINKYIEWKRILGFSIYVKSLEEIISEYPLGDQIGTESGYSGIMDAAGSVRQYLFEQYTDNGLLSALLVGDETVFPVRYGCHLRTKVYEDSLGFIQQFQYWDSETCTDLYFSEFNSDWSLIEDPLPDSTGNSNYAVKYGLDGYYNGQHYEMDYHKEIGVARLLVPSNANGGAQEIENWINKVVTYDYNPGNGNTEYLSKAFISVADQLAAGNSTMNRFNNLYTYLNYDMTTITEDPVDGPLGSPTGSYFTSILNEGYGNIHFGNHGSKDHVSIANWYINDGGSPKYGFWSLDSYDAGNSIYIQESNNGFDNLNADGKFGIAVIPSCNTCNYPGLPSSNICMARAFTSYLQNSGGPLYVGTTGPVSISYGPRFCYQLLDWAYIHNRRTPISDSFTRFLWPNAGSYYKMELFGLHMIGDPLCEPYYYNPQRLTARFTGENTLQVLDGSIPVADAECHFENTTTGEYVLGYTNENGIVSANFSYNKLRVLSIGYFPFISNIALPGEVITTNTSYELDLMVRPENTLTIDADISLESLGGRNARIVVSDNASLIINDYCTITGYAETIEYENNDETIEVPGNGIDVYGSIIVGDYVNFTSQTGWDGLNIVSDNTTILENSVFIKSQLKSNGGVLDISNSSLFDSGINSQNSQFSISNCSIEGNQSIDGIQCYRNSSVSIHNTDIVESNNGINICDCDSFSVVDCDISDNIRNGILVFKSGEGTHNIINVSVFSNREAGIHIYDSSCNLINSHVYDNWHCGISASRESNVSILRNTDLDDYAQMRVHDNLLEEIVFFENCLFDLNNNQVEISDQSYQPGYWDQYLIVCPDMNTTRNFQNNFWGDLDGDNEPDIPDSMRFIPSMLEPDSLEVGFKLLPISDLIGVMQPVIGGDEALYHEAVSLIESDNYSMAIQKLKQIISNYPEGEFIAYAARELLNIYGDYNALKNYYSTEPNLNCEGSIAKLADYLENYCNIKSRNYEEAIEYFESLIDAAESEYDIVSSEIEIGYIYCLMQLSGERSDFVGQKAQLKPISERSYIKFLDESLLKLYLIPMIDDKGDEHVSEFPVLLRNYPNPFNPETKICFNIPEESSIELSVYNLKGQKVKTLVNEKLNSGTHEILWSGKDNNNTVVASGVYLYRLTANGKTIKTNKCLLLK